MTARKQSPRGTRPPTAPAKRMRRVVASNLAALLERYHPRARFKTDRDQFEAAAKDCGVSPSTIQRQIDPENGITLDTLTDIAVGFDLKAADMLNPDLLPTLSARQGNDGDESENLQRNRD